MKYTFQETTLQQASDFAKQNGIFQQTEEWAAFRSFYKPVAIMGFDGGKAVLSCIVFRLPVYLTPYRIGYATRGFVCDYQNTLLVQEFLAYYKAFAKKDRLVYTIFDPMAEDKINFGEPSGIRQAFEDAGLVRNTGLKLQPNTNYRLNFRTQADPVEEEKRVAGAYALRLKNDIEQSKFRGVRLEKYSGDGLQKAIHIFYELLLQTTEMKGFGHREEAYYYNFAKALEPYVAIYLYKYDSRTDISYTEQVIETVRGQLAKIEAEIGDENTTEKKRERLYPKKKEAEKQLNATVKRLELAKQHTDDPYLSASFFIKMGNKAYNFYGANSPVLRELKLTANYQDMIRDSIDGTVETFNMGGTLKLDTDDIKKDKMYELYKYKCQYGGEFCELAGEYFLISRPKLFRLLHEKLHYFRRIIFHKK